VLPVEILQLCNNADTQAYHNNARNAILDESRGDSNKNIPCSAIDVLIDREFPFIFHLIVDDPTQADKSAKR
jgi:hypothetical protein